MTLIPAKIIKCGKTHKKIEFLRTINVFYVVKCVLHSFKTYIKFSKLKLTVSELQCLTAFDLKLKGHRHEEFTIFEQNKATIPLFIYKTVLNHQEKEIHQVLKEEQQSYGLF